MVFNLIEAIPNIPTEDYNCLVRNGITTYEKLADMTDYDLSMLKYSPKITRLIKWRDQAKFYKQSKEEKKEGTAN